MPTTLRHRFLVALTLALPALAGACNSELNGHAEVLLDALDSDDYAKFQSIAGTELAADIGEGQFHDIAATYDHLGALADKTRNGIGVHNGEHYVTYTLEYANGDAQLEVVSRSDKLDGFKLEGPVWKQAQLTRHRQALETLVAATSAGDHAAARAVVHPSISDADLDGLMSKLAPLGAHRKLEVTDETIPEFRITYAEVELLMTVHMSATSITGFGIRPAAKA